ncbi:IclR family transcriptional regulator [Loktanella sp. DJP18]|uniref:IclR family transcriptional regulator n=1 Tax=Loktanella sp. DJP18 TaxID=3409788 RepID=UPI003BB59F70
MNTGVGSAARILGILELFSEEKLEWTPDEMMAVLGYSRPTLYRYIKALKDSGFLSQNGPHGLTLGPRVVEMDFLMRKSDGLLREGATVLRDLAQIVPCTALLVRWYGNKLLCVASEVSTPDPKSSYPRGRPMPLARGAISRAILAHLPRRQMLAKIAENLPALRDIGLGDTVEEIAEALRRMRRDGALIARGEVTSGVIGVAAPVFDDSQAPIAVLCMTIDRDSLDDETLATVSDVVWAASLRLSDRLTTMRSSGIALDAL